MSNLTIFTLEDRTNLQKLLYLPIEEIEEYGDLYAKLYQVEERDRRLGTDVAGRIKSAIIELIALESAIATDQSDSNYGASEIEEDIKSDYRYKAKFNNNKSIDAGKKARQQYLIRQIKRDLDCLGQSSNRLCLG